MSHPFSPRILAILACSAVHMGSIQAQSWQRLDDAAPFDAGLPLLLTDGTVLVHRSNTRDWWRLTPDASGSYVHGRWSPIAPLPPGYEPYAFASAVLADGRVVVMGGEYNGGRAVWSNRGAVYDPVADRWTAQAPPAGWTSIGDAQCSVLADGRFFLANALDSQTAVLDPATLAWTAFGTGKACSNNEEGYTLLPDGTILTVDVHLPRATERFLPTLGTWISAARLPQVIVDVATTEIGPAVLRPDGTVFAIGASASGRNAVYTPPAVLTDPGSWAVGPAFPDVDGVRLSSADGPACLLPSGNVLCQASPIAEPPSRFFEFDGTSLGAVPGPPRQDELASFQGVMLLLPTGQVLLTDGSSDVEIYTPAGAPAEAWRPTISSVARVIRAGEVHSLSGTQFSGLSQACAFGDDATNATNYPLVRLTSKHTGHVHYARTFGHSTMGVATGATPTSTHFTLPAGIEHGVYSLEVVANGIPSLPVKVVVLKQRPAQGPPNSTVERLPAGAKPVSRSPSRP